MVIWIIGMSASGKTTIGKKLYQKLQNNSKEKWIFVDGDTFRNILGEDLGHTIEDRKINAYRISRFCEFLNSQGINIIACVLSIFHDNQKYNKENIKDYKEIYIKVDFEKLLQRDNKQLYKKALKGEIQNVVGVDIEFKEPYAPDMIIDNNQDNPDYEKIINKIINTLKIPIENEYIYTKQNLLKHPHKYQYSIFEGEEFFIKFKKNRNSTIKFFNNRLNRFNEKNQNILLIPKNYKKENNLILKDYLIFLYNSTNNILLKEEIIIKTLIKRFEVSKKLYTTYDLKEIRKSSTIFDELILYPLFSLVLQKYYNNINNHKKFVYLNAILKVNDIIVSIKSDFIFYEEIKLSLKALKDELNILKEYL